MSKHNIHYHNKIGKFPKIPVNIFLELSEEFSTASKTSSN